jgi:hypothetical protein
LQERRDTIASRSEKRHTGAMNPRLVKLSAFWLLCLVTLGLASPHVTRAAVSEASPPTAVATFECLGL